ncbi:hypothetical protein LIA77_06608 [Sarocladium implicatum]|nr:hypothetical protein LIA77_06608 [Sarocladium implicatum]
MFRSIILTALPLVNGARMNRPGLESRMDAEECCPCPAAGDAAAMLPAAVETVTVEHTVTQQAATVYITQACKPAQITVTCDAVEPSQPQHTVVVVQPPTAPISDGVDDNGDELCDEEEDIYDENVVTKTVTVHAAPAGPKTITVSEVAPAPSEVVETVTVKPMPEPVDQQATVTAPPNDNKIMPEPENYKTVTKTVAGDNGGDDCVEVTVIDVVTGQTTCHNKDTGLPCQSAPNNGDQLPAPAVDEIICDPVNTTTSITTFYNTIIQTVDGPPANTVVMPPTPTEAPISTASQMARRSWWWMPEKA